MKKVTQINSILLDYERYNNKLYISQAKNWQSGYNTSIYKTFNSISDNKSPCWFRAWDIQITSRHIILLITWNVVSIRGQPLCVDMISHFKRCIWLLYFPSDENLSTSIGYTKHSDYIEYRVIYLNLIWLYVCQHFPNYLNSIGSKSYLHLTLDRECLSILLILVVIVKDVHKLKILHKRTMPGFPIKTSSLGHN